MTVHLDATNTPTIFCKDAMCDGTCMTYADPVEVTQPSPVSELEAAWAECDRLADDWRTKRNVARDAESLWWQAFVKVRKLGPRPAVNATTNKEDSR